MQWKVNGREGSSSWNIKQGFGAEDPTMYGLTPVDEHSEEMNNGKI